MTEKGEISMDDTNLRTLYDALVTAEKHCEQRGLEFGHACYQLRESAEVVSGGTTFRATLDQLGIPHATAYRWISRYCEATGKADPDSGRAQRRRALVQLYPEFEGQPNKVIDKEVQKHIEELPPVYDSFAAAHRQNIANQHRRKESPNVDYVLRLRTIQDEGIDCQHVLAKTAATALEEEVDERTTRLTCNELKHAISDLQMWLTQFETKLAGLSCVEEPEEPKCIHLVQ